MALNHNSRMENQTNELKRSPQARGGVRICPHMLGVRQLALILVKASGTHDLKSTGPCKHVQFMPNSTLKTKEVMTSN